MSHHKEIASKIERFLSKRITRFNDLESIRLEVNREFKANYGLTTIENSLKNIGVDPNGYLKELMFTETMDAFLLSNHQAVSRNELLYDFQHRFMVRLSLQKLNNRLDHLGLVRNEKTVQKHKAFLENFYHLDFTNLAFKFNEKFGTSHTPSQIGWKCRYFGLKKRGFIVEDKHVDFLKSLDGQKRKIIHQKFNKHFGLNVTYSWIKSLCSQLKLKPGRKESVTLSDKHHTYLKFLFKEYPNLKLCEIIKLFNKHFKITSSRHAIQKHCVSLGLYEPIKYFKPTKKQLEYVSRRADVPRKELWASFNSEFNLSLTLPEFNGCCIRHNLYGTIYTSLSERRKAPIGWETKNMYGYVLVKVAFPLEYKLKHRKVWEDENGSVPEGHVITFKNGNKEDCRIENLICVSKGELTRLIHARFHSAPSELKETIFLIAKMNQKLSDVTEN